MADFVPKPLYTKKELQSFRDKNMRDGMFVTDEQTVESMEDLEKLLFLWQEETNERMGEDTVSLDGEITKSDGVSYSRLVIQGISCVLETESLSLIIWLCLTVSWFMTSRSIFSG